MPVLRTLAVLALALSASLAAPVAHAQTGQQKYTQICHVCHGLAGNNHNGVLAGEDWTVIRQAIFSVGEMIAEVRPLYQAGFLTDNDLMLIADYLAAFTGGGPTTVPVVEYFNAGFGHYFMTADADEITGLDGGAFGGAFVRTGRQFVARGTPEAGTVPVCRFFTTPGTFGFKSSHFYTADPVECEGLKLNANWIYEKIAFHIAVPAGGACAGGTLPVYRMYNDGQTQAPNHRFTTDLALYQQFVGTMGWLPENIRFCAP